MNRKHFGLSDGRAVMRPLTLLLDPMSVVKPTVCKLGAQAVTRKNSAPNPSVAFSLLISLPSSGETWSAAANDCICEAHLMVIASYNKGVATRRNCLHTRRISTG